jgi:hypothetical protein
MIFRYSFNRNSPKNHEIFQHLSEDTENSDHTVHYIVSGAASRAHYNTDHMDSVPEDSLKFYYPHGFNPFAQIGFTHGAFVMADVSAERGKFEVYGGRDGSEKYSVEFEPRNV